MSDGFLGRWAKRKEAARKGEELPPEPQVAKIQAPQPSPQPSPASGRGSGEGDSQAVAPSPHRGEGGGEGRAAVAAPPSLEETHTAPPTLEEAQSLTPDSDFTRFARPGVAPEVKNAAFKKLFTDPHFNVMDGLDVYIDDYSKPDPIPPEMLRQLVGAKFLKLFGDEEEKDPPQAAASREDAHDPAPEIVAQSGSRTEHALPPAEDHADPDLRLQQDDAPGPEGPGAGAR